MILNLDKQPVTAIIKGETYLVPTVNGLPIVVPSHIDEGDNGPTARHWHVDNRWGDLARPLQFFCDATKAHVNAALVSPSIIKDGGENVEYQPLVAQSTEIQATGEVFGTLIYLYLKHGKTPAKDGFCAHHRTQLQEDAGCLVCPAHGMRYKQNGDPMFEGPLRLKAYHENRFVGDGPVTSTTILISIERELTCSYLDFLLCDSNGKVVAEYKWEGSLCMIEGDELRMTFSSWPSDTFCPGLRT
jgi:hypothetical protein